MNSFNDPQKSLEESLQRLKLDYVDMLLLHFSFSLWDTKSPLHVVWPKMEALVDQGLAKCIGVSNFNVQLTADLLCYARIPPACN